MMKKFCNWQRKRYAQIRKLIKDYTDDELEMIFPGERLILTYETEQTMLNTGKIKQLVERYL